MTWASSLESHFSVCLMLRNWLKPTVSYADVSTFDSLSPPLNMECVSYHIVCVLLIRSNIASQLKMYQFTSKLNLPIS